MTPAILRASRYMTWALRHAPNEAGITLDEYGWASVPDLLASLRRGKHAITVDMLHEIVASDDKRRYALSEDGRKIRTNHGHSIEIKLDVAPSEPPPLLYHGTARRNLGSIKVEGLTAQKRRYVHLSDDMATAMAVGSRHGPVVIIPIDAAAMHAAGALFYLTSTVWLTEAVLPSYLRFNALSFV